MVDKPMCSECGWTEQQIVDAGMLCACNGAKIGEHDYKGHTCYYVDEDGNTEATGDECYECLQEHRRRRYGDNIHNTDCVCNACRGEEHRGADY